MIVKRNPPEKKLHRKAAADYQVIIFDNYIRFKWPFFLEQQIMNAFSFLNPEYLQLCKKRGYSAIERPHGYITAKEKKDGRWTTRKIPQYVYYWSFDGSDLVVPRGAWATVRRLFNRHGGKYRITNNRYTLPATNFTFKSKLLKRRAQHKIIGYSAKNGIIQAGTGVGKTVLFLYQCTIFQQPACVVVDTKELMNQWKKRINQHLEIPINKIGQIGSGVENIQPITVALMQTLRDTSHLLKNFSFLGIDECHISAVDSYGSIINNYSGLYLMALSATPRRRDGKTRVMFWYCGRIKLKISKEAVERLPATGWFINTRYEGEIDFRRQYSIALSTMLADEERNKEIVENIIRRIDFYGIHLIISRSAIHLETLIGMMPHHFQLISKLLVGKVKDKDRQEIVSLAEQNKLKFLFATDKIIEKGFDEEMLSLAHIVSPVKDPDKIEQICGRVTRVPIKSEIVLELKKSAMICYYFDSKEQVLRSAASNTSKRFGELKIRKRIQESKLDD